VSSCRPGVVSPSVVSPGVSSGVVLVSSVLVSPGVQGEVIAARERSFTQLTLERSVSGVLAIMPRQLVGSRESPRAVRPRTPVRLLARVSAQVCLQV